MELVSIDLQAVVPPHDSATVDLKRAALFFDDQNFDIKGLLQKVTCHSHSY